MTERNLIKHFKRIVYEEGADRTKINEVLTTYRISQSEVSKTEEELVIICAGEVWGLDPDQVLEKSRKDQRPMAKHFIAHYLKNNKSITLQTISNLIGFNHHSSVLHSERKINNLLDVDKDIRNKYAKFEQLIKERL